MPPPPPPLVYDICHCCLQSDWRLLIFKEKLDVDYNVLSGADPGVEGNWVAIHPLDPPRKNKITTLR